MRISDWSADVCSSDLHVIALHQVRPGDVLDLHQGAQRHQLVGGRAHLQAVDVLALHAELLVGLGTHLVDAAEGVEVVHVRSEEHTSELQSLMRISYAVFCLKKKNKKKNQRKQK